MFRALYKIPFHPFDENYEIKRKKRNYLPASLTVLFLLFLGSIVDYQFTDFVFNRNRTDQLNVWMMLLQTVVIFILWVIANWAFCTLFDGEGNLEQIFCASALALIPYTATLFIKTFISSFMIAEEGIFLVWLVNFGRIYSIVLLFIALQVIHGYSVKKTFFSIVVSVMGIAVILFIIMLLFSLVQQVAAFLVTVMTEFTLIIGG
ncbi:MAG: Yip1 family protein [Candidatus Delongbacteria bacterium]